jgi:tetratricopeptide (TPR) repeat protein
MFNSARLRVALKGGTMLLRRKRWRPAAFLLRRATKLEPGNWEAQNNLTIALLKMERWEDAARVAQHAIGLNPTAVESRDFLGIALLQLERWEEAAAAYRRAIEADSSRYELYDRLGMALWRLSRWDEVIEISEAALKLDISRYPAHHRLGVALLQLGRWDAAAAALRHAITLAAGDPAAAPQLPGMQIQLVSATAQLDPADESLSAGLLQHAESLHPGTAARFSRGIELLKQEQWDEAAAHLSAPGLDLGALDFLRVDPLVRLGRLPEAVAAHQRAVAAGGPMPSLPGVPAADRFQQRQAGFWTPENLGADVFAVERWLEELSVVPDEVPTGPRLLFVLDTDFGELATVKFFILGQELAGRSTLLLPEKLYRHNVDAIPGRTQRYASADDILAAVDREQSDIVLLCAGYLLCPHLEFTAGDLARLIDGLRERGCRIVTADPFLGQMSRQDPRTVIRFEITGEHVRRMAAAAGFPGVADDMIKSRRDAEERTWISFTRSERILRNTYHLYPSYCDLAGDVGETDARNLAFFNDRLLRPARSPDGSTPHWLFILGTADCEIQAVVEGETAFVDIVAKKLLETRAAGRHPVLIGPRAFVEQLMARMPTAVGIDILSQCPFTQFYALLLSAEHTFYWNIVSHSLLIRLYNQLPIVQFDHGHLIRTAPAIYDRIVGWYYQGWAPPVRNHHEPLTLATVEGWAAEYRPHAGRLVARYRRAPSPEQMIGELMDKAPSPGLEAELAGR